MKRGFGQTGRITASENIVMAGVHCHVGAMAKRSPLDDPRVSAHAWRHYKQLMIGMVGMTVLVVIVALTVIYLTVGMVSVHAYIAAGLGIVLTMMLMSALMGLVFLSSGTGHDEAVSNLEDGDADSWGQDSGDRNR
jgi:hypothetical protein